MEQILIISFIAVTTLACSSQIHRVNNIVLTEITQNGKLEKCPLEDTDILLFIYDKDYRIVRWKGIESDIKYIYNADNITLIDNYLGREEYDVVLDGENNAIQVSGGRAYAYDNNNLQYIGKKQNHNNRDTCNIEWANGNICKISTYSYDDEKEHHLTGIIEFTYSKYENKQNYSMAYGIILDMLSSDEHHISSALSIAGVLGRQPKNLISKISIRPKSGGQGVVTIDYTINRDGTIHTEQINWLFGEVWTFVYNYKAD